MSSREGGEFLFSSQWEAFGGLSVGRVAAGRSLGVGPWVVLVADDRWPSR